MNSIFVIVIVALAAAAAFWWWSRERAAKTRAQTQARKSETGRQNRFAGVQIRLGPAACTAARSLADQRFLVGEAPALPLPGCTEARCRCSFQRLSDRRTDLRRWADEGVVPTIFSAAERREHSDRRDS